jgi:murein DD-endopeptidase MepM/ murein hydrolase activator NlpD
MGKNKYKYNPSTLDYELVSLTTGDHIKKIGSFIMTGLVFASLIIFIAYTFFDSPKETALKRENKQLQIQYTFLNKRLNNLEEVLEDVQHRDDNIYRTIFEAEPIPDNIRKAGIGGANRYVDLEGFEHSTTVIETTKQLDLIEKQLYIQSKSFDEVIEMAINKEEMLASIPAIQPISNQELKRMASGYGYRMHPIYKTRKLHTGMDFTAPTGTEIFATGNGVIKNVVRSKKGYGNHIVIDHGFAYETLYAHMSKFNVIKGQKIRRGDVIGYVGSTGTSTAPHLHYEVHKDGKKINPINFYFNDLTPEEYDEMIEISSSANQSFD